METFLKLCFVYVVGGTAGWIMEFFFRRFAHKKWVNPGFLVGPNLPLYGIGTLVLYLISSAEYGFITSPAWRAVFVVFMITFAMTFIEYITGLIFIKGMKVKLWDYSDRWGNIQGIICPLFTLFWGIIGAAYYFLIHPYIEAGATAAAEFVGSGFLFGAYFGVMVVDIFYSFKVVAKIREWAKTHNAVVKLEELRLSIKNRADKFKEKCSFILSFKSRKGIGGELDEMKKSQEGKENAETVSVSEN